MLKIIETIWIFQSLIEMAFVIGQSSGPMIGGFMYAHFGYSAPFLVLTVINFMAYLITILATYNDTSKGHFKIEQFVKLLTIILW